MFFKQESSIGQSLNGLRYLITGGAGFIGSNLAKVLVGRGAEVLVVDNLSTGNMENLREAQDKVNFFKINSGDVLDRPEMENLAGIFHLGIPSSSPLYKENHKLVGDSINEFINILELAQRENCKLVYASSSSLYNGNPPPLKEEMNILPTDYYAEARYAMERLAEMYNMTHKTKSIALRLFSVYGWGEKYKGKYANLVSQFLWSIEKGESPLIYGDGSQTRDLIFVKDVARAFILAMESMIEFDILNIGTGKSYTVNQLVEVLNRILNKEIQPQYLENPIKNYVFHTLADTRKAQEILGFEAEHSLEDGINQILGSNQL